MSRVSKSEIEEQVKYLAKLANLSSSKSEAIKKGDSSYLTAEYAPVYGGWRLIMVNVKNGGHGGAFGESSTQGRLSSKEFKVKLDALETGLSYKKGK